MKIRVLVINDDCFSASNISNERFSRGFSINQNIITKGDFCQSARYNRLIALNSMLDKNIVFSLSDIYSKQFTFTNLYDATDSDLSNLDPASSSFLLNKYQRSLDEAEFLNSFEFYTWNEHAFFNTKFIKNNFDCIFCFFNHPFSEHYALDDSLVSLLEAEDCPTTFLLNVRFDKQTLNSTFQNCINALSDRIEANSSLDYSATAHIEYYLRNIFPKASYISMLSRFDFETLQNYYQHVNELLAHYDLAEIKKPNLVFSHSAYLNFRRSDNLSAFARTFKFIHDYARHSFTEIAALMHNDKYHIQDSVLERQHNLDDIAEFEVRATLNEPFCIDLGPDSTLYCKEALSLKMSLSKSNSTYIELLKFKHTLSSSANNSNKDSSTFSNFRLDSSQVFDSENQQYCTKGQDSFSFDSAQCAKCLRSLFKNKELTIVLSSKFFTYDSFLGMDIIGLKLIFSVREAFPSAKLVLNLNDGLYSYIDAIKHNDTIIEAFRDRDYCSKGVHIAQNSSRIANQGYSIGLLSSTIVNIVNQALKKHILVEAKMCGYELEYEDICNEIDSCIVSLDYENFFKTNTGLVISDRLNDRVISSAKGVTCLMLAYDEDALRSKNLFDVEYLTNYLLVPFAFSNDEFLVKHFTSLAQKIYEVNQLKADEARTRYEQAILVDEKRSLAYSAKHLEQCTYLVEKKPFPFLSLEAIAHGEKSLREQLLIVDKAYTKAHFQQVVELYYKDCENFDIHLIKCFYSLFKQKFVMPSFHLEENEEHHNISNAQKESLLRLINASQENLHKNHSFIEINSTLKEQAHKSIDERVAQLSNFTYNRRYELLFAFARYFLILLHAEEQVSLESNKALVETINMLDSAYLNEAKQNFKHIIEQAYNKVQQDFVQKLEQTETIENTTQSSLASWSLETLISEQEQNHQEYKDVITQPIIPGDNLVEHEQFFEHLEINSALVQKNTGTDLNNYNIPCFKPFTVNILSFGCSTGAEVFDLLRYFNGQKITGIDISTGAIHAAKQKLRNLHKLNRYETERELAVVYNPAYSFFNKYRSSDVISMLKKAVATFSPCSSPIMQKLPAKVVSEILQDYVSYDNNFKQAHGSSAMISHMGAIGYLLFDSNENFFKYRQELEEQGVKYGLFSKNEMPANELAQFDLVTAMTVLCRHPDTSALQNSHVVYPFAEFNAVLHKLDRLVKKGGLLCIFNANYRLEDTDLNDKYIRLFPFYESTKLCTLLDLVKEACVEQISQVIPLTQVKQDEVPEANSQKPYSALLNKYELLRKATALYSTKINSFLKEEEVVNKGNFTELVDLNGCHTAHYAQKFIKQMTKLSQSDQLKEEEHIVIVPESLRKLYEEADLNELFGHTALFNQDEQRISRQDLGAIFYKIAD